MFFEIRRKLTVIVSPLRLVLDLAVGFIYSLEKLFSSVLVFVAICLHDLDKVLIVMEDRGHGNGIKHVEDDFTKSFEIVFTILSGIILCGTSESSYKVSFYFRKKTRYIPFNEIELTVTLGIKSN